MCLDYENVYIYDNILGNNIWIFVYSERWFMSKQGQELIDAIENLQNDYGACKIDTNQFVQKLNELGIFTAEEIDFELANAEDARYLHKLDQAKAKEKQ